MGHGGSEGVRNGDLRGGVVRGKFDDEVPDPQVARVSGEGRKADGKICPTC